MVRSRSKTVDKNCLRSFSIRVSSLITPVYCITQTEEPNLFMVRDVVPTEFSLPSLAILCRFFSCATLHKSLCQVKKTKKSRGLWHTIVVLNCDGKDLIGKVIHFSLFVADILLSSPKKGEGLWVRVINHLCHYFRKKVLIKQRNYPLECSLKLAKHQ